MMILFAIFLCLVGVYGEQYTLPGECPDVKIQENLNFTKFIGLWHVIAAYASDERHIYDCDTLDLQQDNMGYTWRETYVDTDGGNRTQMTYSAKMDANLDAGNNRPQFIVNHKALDKVLQYPFYILSTDYDSYAVAYFCKWLKETPRTHYVFSWVLTRSKEKLKDEVLKNIEKTISKYPELAQHRQSFVFKEFNKYTCSYSNKSDAELFTNHVW